eukprot:CAMPEP_0178898776 /NCGR_PEP_ID=MMETSP0786-20121207/2531_1 /TAXON_ID=186022 /ORGANISM="Thalassionema frauenfeldii, Strain CCMP 1798" /LENGTH=122 /DNA_ID=CAMNT_0020569557 /DNA_START=201 /DNA_END=566 /DNA_ORIENTATION=-
MFLKAISSVVWDDEKDLFPYGIVVDGCPFPDLCVFGYTSEQILDWYQAIDAEGRRRYGMLALMDLFILMPMYSLFLGTEIYLSFPNFLSYVPFLALLFDLIETLTHGYAVVMFPNQLPSKMW